MILGRLTLKQLEAFAAVADAGSFRKAAETLGTTQPNVSERIAVLETMLDVRLMRRDARAVRLTERGEALLVHARRVLAAADDLIEAAGRRDAIAGRLRLGATELVAATWLRAFLRRFRSAYPSVGVELGIDLSTEIARRLADGACDLALLAGAEPAKGPGDTDLGLQPFAWLASPQTAATVGPAPTVGGLLARSVLTHSRHTAAVQALHAFCARQGLPTDRIVCSSSASACLQMAEDGMGVALVPAAMGRGQVAAGTLTALEPDWTPEPLRVLARLSPERAPSFAVRAVEMAVAAAAEDRES